MNEKKIKDALIAKNRQDLADMIDVSREKINGDHTIIYGIIDTSTEANAKQLPFFSKVSLIQTHNNLTDLGFEVALNWIRPESGN